jgi:hypothetical protein
MAGASAAGKNPVLSCPLFLERHPDEAASHKSVPQRSRAFAARATTVASLRNSGARSRRNPRELAVALGEVAKLAWDLRDGGGLCRPPQTKGGAAWSTQLPAAKKPGVSSLNPWIKFQSRARRFPSAVRASPGAKSRPGRKKRSPFSGLQEAIGLWTDVFGLWTPYLGRAFQAEPAREDHLAISAGYSITPAAMAMFRRELL